MQMQGDQMNTLLATVENGRIRSIVADAETEIVLVEQVAGLQSIAIWGPAPVPARSGLSERRYWCFYHPSIPGVWAQWPEQRECRAEDCFPGDRSDRDETARLANVELRKVIR